MSLNDVVCEFYVEISKDKNHRYKSWEHCFDYFNRNESFDIDQGALHLAFYLASWGMYRGSSGLLWKDYRIHSPAIQIIRNTEYRAFDVLSGNKITKESYKLKLKNLHKELEWYYEKQSFSTGKKTRTISATHTLITKIILGTTGAFPALDRLFCDGFKTIRGQRISHLNENSIGLIWDFAVANKSNIENAQMQIHQLSGAHYPVMKIVDMYFWQIGAIEEMHSKGNLSN
jgi:hypothetical protein